jgi:hypothetical protein
MLYIAHAGHWITTVAYFSPVVAFLVWLGITQLRERRSGHRGLSARRNGPR